MTWYRMSGSSKGELHGASVSVSTSFDDLVGKNVYLYLGSELKQTKVFGTDKTISFNDILDVGTYTVKVDDTETYKSVDVLISAEEIINRTVKTISIVESGIELVVGNTYSFGGYDWTCAEVIDGGYVLQSQGVTADTWNNLFNSATTDQDGVDCHSNNTVLNTLYSNISYAEKIGASYGSGLFLVSNAKCGFTAIGSQGSGYYWEATHTAAQNNTKYGAKDTGTWLGNLYSSGSPWCSFSDGTVGYGYPKNYVSFVVAPAFNLDKTKAYLSGTTILVK